MFIQLDLTADQIGDVSAVFWLLSTSLRSAKPLPFITPCPLMERMYTLPSQSHENRAAISRTASRSNISGLQDALTRHSSRQADRDTPQHPDGHYLDSRQPEKPAVKDSAGTPSNSRRQSLDDLGHLTLPLPNHTHSNRSNDQFNYERIQEPGFMVFSAGVSLSFAIINRIE